MKKITGEELNEKLLALGLTASGLNGMENAVVGFQVCPPDEEAKAEDTGLEVELRAVRLVYDFDKVYEAVDAAYDEEHTPADVVEYIDKNVIQALQNVPETERPIIVKSL